VVPDDAGWPAAYQYKVGDKALAIPLEDDAGWPNLIHLKSFHPADDHERPGNPLSRRLAAGRAAGRAHRRHHRRCQGSRGDRGTDRSASRCRDFCIGVIFWSQNAAAPLQPLDRSHGRVTLRHILVLATLSAAAMALGGCQTTGQLPGSRIAEATFKTASGLPAGTAQFFRDGSQVRVAVALAGFTPGQHGMHLHTTGKCEGPDFSSAGGHLNPAGHQHGTENPQGAHLGDLPNVTVGSNGTGTATSAVIGTPEEVMTALFDSDGTAIVVHAGPDDYKTDPAGNSGGREACGVVTRT
jgi:Cu-Zn family superoxide dismutase